MFKFPVQQSDSLDLFKMKTWSLTAQQRKTAVARLFVLVHTDSLIHVMTQIKNKIIYDLQKACFQYQSHRREADGFLNVI